MYKILPYSQKKAKQLGVEIKPSKLSGKKIDVFKDGKKIASIGALGYNDYPNFMQLESVGAVEKGTANKRRAEYKRRHENDRHVRGSAGYYADQILW